MKEMITRACPNTAGEKGGLDTFKKFQEDTSYLFKVTPLIITKTSGRSEPPESHQKNVLHPANAPKPTKHLRKATPYYLPENKQRVELNVLLGH